MILLCPKAFSSNTFNLERDFLKFYLSRKGIKAKICDELWEAFRYRLLENSTNKDNATQFIAEQKGFFKSENTKESKLTKEFKELIYKRYEEDFINFGYKK